MKKKNSNFKIIAIKALKDCDSDYTKVLVKEQLYYFYSDYKIDINDKGIETIKNLNIESYPAELFNIKKHEGLLNVNLCAIVGKNGSGKSSIVELLFRAINNIAFNYKWEKDSEINTITANLKLIKGIHVVFYYQTDKIYKVTLKESNFEVHQFYSNGKLNDKELKSFDLSKLFYTEAVNYSHYAFNSLQFGYYEDGKFVDWLKELFHKNDSYQTPLVLNPMRTNGNFDINRENDLVKQRLLANLLRPIENNNVNFRKLSENLDAYNLVLRLREKKTSVSYFTLDSKGQSIERFYNLSVFTKSERKEIVQKLMSELVDYDGFDKSTVSDITYKNAEFYIIYKLVSICKKYSDYQGFLLSKNKKFKPELFDDFVTKLKLDTSHITFKLKQTLNYLKNDFINYERYKFLISIDKLSKEINKIRKSNKSILEYLPPPIFDIDIKLKSIDENFSIDFSTLSSGEKQQIYMVSSLLYHLYNIDSVDGKKIKYKSINILLEEIELYFHPEMQKSFIKYFIDSISRIELKNIESINICFITHSPFILSDIPSNNILFLEVEDGKAIQRKNKRKTFGANIHELLTDNFFMTNGFIGDFAKNKINETIKWLNDEIINKRNFEKKYSDLYKINQEKLNYHKGIISLIDEPIVKIKLGEMLSDVEPKEKKFHIDLIKQQIKFLQDKIKDS